MEGKHPLHIVMLISFVKLLVMLTSASRECLFINSSDSNFSFWFGTTLGILKRNLGLCGGSCCCCWWCWLLWWLWWWVLAVGWNISPCPWWPGAGCWGCWENGNMLKEVGAALCSILPDCCCCFSFSGLVRVSLRLLATKFSFSDHLAHFRWIWYWLSGWVKPQNFACVAVVWPWLCVSLLSIVVTSGGCDRVRCCGWCRWRGGTSLRGGGLWMVGPTTYPLCSAVAGQQSLSPLLAHNSTTVPNLATATTHPHHTTAPWAKGISSLSLILSISFFHKWTT